MLFRLVYIILSCGLWTKELLDEYTWFGLSFFFECGKLNQLNQLL